ncbi:MAG: helix-turn-helix domain-containing protein [Leptospira sp.]|nr:helix-turn-helix domain-containing protein [Leptospira sp.]
MSKKSNNDLPWICLSGEIKKLKEYWCEVSKSNLPMMIIGDSGVGKSFWIQKSIDIKSESKNIQKIKIDYSVKEKWFDTINFQIKTDSLKVFWWENFNQANQEEIQKWNSWWKNQKYNLTSDLAIYWEINSQEIEQFNKSKIANELFDQFKSFQFQLPTLKERITDLPLFVTHFLESANAEMKKSITNFDEGFYQFFSKRKYKNNLHELRDIIFSLVAYTSKKQIQFSKIPIHFFQQHIEALDIKIGVSLDAYEKAIIKQNLKFVNGNRLKAAKLLGISERNLYRKISDYQLDEET